MSKRQRAAKRRGRGGQPGKSRHGETRSQADLVYDRRTSPERAAEVLLEAFGDDPVDPIVVPSFAIKADVERARAVVAAALEQKVGPTSLSLAADLALLEGRPRQAEEHLIRALGMADSPELQLRMAGALEAQGKLAAAVEVLDRTLAAHAGLGAQHLARGDLLADLLRREVQPAADCPCGSGRAYEKCCQPAGRRVLDRFGDRTRLLHLQDAVGRFMRSRPDLEHAFATAMETWVRVGAVSEEELAAWIETAKSDPARREAGTLKMMREWAWLMPVVGEEETILGIYAHDPDAAADVARLAKDAVGWAMWGLWELTDPTADPGVVVTELLTGVRLHVEVPASLLAGLSRWSVLLGYFVPVDGVWRCGSGLVSASPVEGREVAHQFVDALLDLKDKLGREGRPLVAWARHVHDELTSLWLPKAADNPTDALAGYVMLVRAMAPTLMSWLRAQHTPPNADDHEPAEFVEARLGVANGRAAWRALKTHPDFVEEGDQLGWLSTAELDEYGEESALRGLLSAQKNVLVAEVDSGDDVVELLDVLAGLGHPARVLEEELVSSNDFDDDVPTAPVTLPDDPDEVAAALRAWPDRPLEVLDGITPRQALTRYRAVAAVEMLVRYLEYEADTRQLVNADTDALREELGLPSATGQAV